MHYLLQPGAMIPRSPHAPHVSRQNLMVRQRALWCHMNVIVMVSSQA